ncbi:hypothetical protein [Flavobacterium sp.]|uniref:hypothetical protein n=1 Tax=Flavobacterium sp. TaxID=239 RepID=UPI003F69FE06
MNIIFVYDLNKNTFISSYFRLNFSKISQCYDHAVNGRYTIKFIKINLNKIDELNATS